jgi:hypothetical protein
MNAGVPKTGKLPISEKPNSRATLAVATTSKLNTGIGYLNAIMHHCVTYADVHRLRNELLRSE